MTLSKFDEMPGDVPVTEGIKYTGSKLKLLPHILRLADKTKAKTVFDGFTGTTRVSQALAQRGYQVIASDRAAWSKVLADCYLINHHPRHHYAPLIEHLNALEGVDGWFTEHYGGDPNRGGSVGADGLKKPWQRHNTRRLDAIRSEIDRLQISQVEKAVLITSLLLALDRVDSTLGHFASYLNEWSPRSYHPLKLDVPRLIPNTGQHRFHTGDIFEVLPKVSADLAYFDPPYGSNNEKMPPSRVRYSAYYHLWTTVCLNDRPNIFGKAKRRIDSSDSVGGSIFEEYRKDKDGRFLAVKAIQKLLHAAEAKFIILSYSSGGRATAGELHEIIAEVGTPLEVIELDYKRNVMAEMKWTHAWVKEAEEPNKEFLFLIEKNSKSSR